MGQYLYLRRAVTKVDSYLSRQEGAPIVQGATTSLESTKEGKTFEEILCFVGLYTFLNKFSPELT